MKYTVVGIIMAISATYIPFAKAETSVINNVTVSAETGGNSAGGIITEGKSKASAFIKTVINGEVVELVDEEVRGSTESEAVFERASSYESEDGSVKTKTNVFLQTSEPVEESAGAGETFKNIVDTKEKQINEKAVEEEEKPTFLAAVFQKLRIYVLSIFN